MPSSFAGMDSYLASQAISMVFHVSFISNIRDSLQVTLELQSVFNRCQLQTADRQLDQLGRTSPVFLRPNSCILALRSRMLRQLTSFIVE
jgi:hypothetical protein